MIIHLFILRNIDKNYVRIVFRYVYPRLVKQQFLCIIKFTRSIGGEFCTYSVPHPLNYYLHALNIYCLGLVKTV